MFFITLTVYHVTKPSWNRVKVPKNFAHNMLDLDLILIILNKFQEMYPSAMIVFPETVFAIGIKIGMNVQVV